MKSAKQAIENMEYVRRLLEQKQPGFAASLEFAASLVETSLENPMDDELYDSIEQARRMPSRFGSDRKVAEHAEIFNLLADVARDLSLAVPLQDAHVHARQRS